MTNNNDQPKSIFSGVFTGYLILILHLVLIVALAATVIFLKSLYDIRWLLLTVGLILIALSAWFFYKRIKNSNRRLTDMINNPALQGRSLEISLLGGMATFKLGDSGAASPLPILIDEHSNDIKLLEIAQPSRLNSLSELKKLLDDNLITTDEFIRLKNEIMAPSDTFQQAQAGDEYVIVKNQTKKL